MPDAYNEVTVAVTAEEERRLREALRLAGLPADGSVEELVREVIRARVPPFLGHRGQAAEVLSLGKNRGY